MQINLRLPTESRKPVRRNQKTSIKQFRRPAPGTITRSFCNPPRRENGSLPRNVCSTGSGPKPAGFGGWDHYSFDLMMSTTWLGLIPRSRTGVEQTEAKPQANNFPDTRIWDSRTTSGRRRTLDFESREDQPNRQSPATTNRKSVFLSPLLCP